MIRDIERVLGTRIERRRLPDFNYGGFAPESQFQRSQPEPHHQARSNSGQNHGRRNGGSYRPRRRS